VNLLVHPANDCDNEQDARAEPEQVLLGRSLFEVPFRAFIRDQCGPDKIVDSSAESRSQEQSDPELRYRDSDHFLYLPYDVEKPRLGDK